MINLTKEQLFNPKLTQVDSTKNSDEVLQSRLPELFIPIRGREMPYESVNYCLCHCADDEEGTKLYRMIALKDFEDRNGNLVQAGSQGAVVDAKTYFAHDGSWADSASRLYGVNASGKTLFENGTVVQEANIRNSLISSGFIIRAVLEGIEDSEVKYSGVVECCSIVGSKVLYSSVNDRTHIKNSTLNNSEASFALINDSNLDCAKVFGDTAAVNQIKVRGKDLKGARLSVTPRRYIPVKFR